MWLAVRGFDCSAAHLMRFGSVASAFIALKRLASSKWLPRRSNVRPCAPFHLALGFQSNGLHLATCSPCRSCFHNDFAMVSNPALAGWPIARSRLLTLRSGMKLSNACITQGSSSISNAKNAIVRGNFSDIHILHYIVLALFHL